MTEPDPAAHLGVRHLQSRYADVVSRRDWDEFGELFVPDCPVTLDLRDRGERVFTGPAEIGSFIAESISVFEFFRFEVVNTVIETGLDGDPDLAGARMYMCEVRYQSQPDEWTQMHGLYLDRMRRFDDGWRFVARRYHSVGRQAADPSVFDWPQTDWNDI